MLKEITIAKANAWAKFVRMFPKLANFAEPAIYINNRFSSTAGMCYYEKREIAISSKLYAIDPSEIISQTVPHEVAHQVAWDLFKEPGHGKLWKDIMVAYGLKPDRCHSIGVEKIPDNAFEMLARRDSFAVGISVQFEHRDRSRKVTIYKGTIEKIDLKTLKVNVGGSIWTVPIDLPSLRIL